MLTRQTQYVDEADTTDDRLAAYSVTKVLRGYTRTGLPTREIPRVGPADHDDFYVRPFADRPAVELHPVEDRRAEPRLPAHFTVCVSHPGDEEPIDGFTVDVSMSGLHLRMPEPPSEAHQDVLVSDEKGTSVLWVQVLKFRFVPELDSYSWHARVIAADDEWPELIGRLSPPVD